MATNEKAHLHGAGLLKTKRAVPNSVSHSATFSVDAVIGAVRIEDVWRALGGGELRRGRGRAFWRDGDGLNVALDPKRGTWRDFATNAGGGILQLIQTVRGCSKGEAFEWLADLAGVALTPFSADRRRRYAEASQRAAERAKLAIWWLESRCEALEELKRSCNGDDGTWDEAALAAASGELFRLHQMDAAAVLSEFSKARQTEPARTRELIQAGRAYQEQEDQVFRRIVAHGWVSR